MQPQTYEQYEKLIRHRTEQHMELWRYELSGNVTGVFFDFAEIARAQKKLEKLQRQQERASIDAGSAPGSPDGKDGVSPTLAVPSAREADAKFSVLYSAISQSVGHAVSHFKIPQE